MKITAIKQQVKQTDRYSVYVDAKYTFSLSETALLESRLVSGQEVSAADISAFKKLSGDDKLYNAALRYAAMRPRSQWEVAMYLGRKQADPKLAEHIVAKLEALRFIDDKAFAESWLASRRQLKSVSFRKLRLEFQQKHVPLAIVDEVLAEDETDELEVIRQTVTKLRRQSRYQDDQKLMQFLARQGFGYNDIKQAMSEME